MDNDFSSFILIMIGFFIGYYLFGGVREWRAWIYINNSQSISRVYIGSYDDLNKCRYDSREYIKAHLNDYGNLKFEYLCGKKCGVDEGSCESRFSSGYLRYPPDQLEVETALNYVKDSYAPEFLTYAWPWEFWYVNQKQMWGLGSRDDESITTKYVTKYLPFESSVNEYSDLTLSNDLNLYLSPREFEAVLKTIMQHPNFY